MKRPSKLALVRAIAELDQLAKTLALNNDDAASRKVSEVAMWLDAEFFAGELEIQTHV